MTVAASAARWSFVQGGPSAARGPAQDLLGPLAQPVGRLRLDELGVVAVDLPAARVGELGEQVAVHDRVGAGLVRRAALDGDVVREAGRPETAARSRRAAPPGGVPARSSSAAEHARTTDARTVATRAVVAATSRRPLS